MANDPIRLQCPVCSAVVKAKASIANKKVKCPKCKTFVYFYSPQNNGSAISGDTNALDPIEVEENIRLVCSNCGKAVKAPASLLGRRLQCKSCGKRSELIHPDQYDTPKGDTEEFVPISEEDKQKSRRNCPFCGESILLMAIKCKHCGEFIAKNKGYTPCKYCFADIPVAAIKCSHCGEYVNKQDDPSRQNKKHRGDPRSARNALLSGDYFVLSILATLFCCLPFGVVAIVFSCQRNSAIANGDYVAARIAGKRAKTYFWLSVISGLVVAMCYFLLLMIGG